MNWEKFADNFPTVEWIINNQENLILDLIIALWLIEKWKSAHEKEQWAKMMIALMQAKIQPPADWKNAMQKAKLHILK